MDKMRKALYLLSGCHQVEVQFIVLFEDEAHLMLKCWRYAWMLFEEGVGIGFVDIWRVDEGEQFGEEVGGFDRETGGQMIVI